MTSAPPLTGVRVLEFAGLAPGPFAGMLLADFGATVIRVDRAHSSAHTSSPPPPTPDNLVRHKSSIAVNLKSPSGVNFIKSVLRNTDVVIDPFRPGVLEKLGLSPEDVMMKINSRLIVARMTGYRRDGKYAQMAGHDINYIAVSGALSMLGRKGENPYPPGNILGDFAGGGLTCFLGIVLAMLSREKTGKGQIVEANMVDGSAYLATFLRLASKTPMWNSERGTNMLDGGSPYYATYETEDGKFMSVGALEPQFFAEFMNGLSLKDSDLPGPREDKRSWPAMSQIFRKKFKSKSRAEWERIYEGTDACVAPVLTNAELELSGFDQRPIVTLKGSPALAIAHGDMDHRSAAEGQGPGVPGQGYSAKTLSPGMGGERVVDEWMGWSRGQQYQEQDGGLILTTVTTKSKL